MGWLDSISSVASGISDFIGKGSPVYNIASTAGGLYDIYQTFNTGQKSNDLYDSYLDILASNEKYASQLFARQKSKVWPYEDLQYQYALEDMKAMRPLAEKARDEYVAFAPEQIEYQSQRAKEQLDQMKILNPQIDAAERQVVSKLTEDGTSLRNRMMNTAATDVNSAFSKRRAQDNRMHGLMGINPNSGAASDYNLRMSTSQALASAGAQTNASRTAEDLTLSRNAQAMNYRAGLGLPNYQVTTPSSSSGVGGSLTGTNYTNAAQTLQGAEAFGDRSADYMQSAASWFDPDRRTV